MNVGHHLASVLAAADNKPIALFVNALLPGEFIGHPGHTPDKRYLVVSQIGQRRYMPLGYYQHMGRGQRVDITEGHNLIILVQRIAGKLTGHNSAENTFHGLAFLFSILGSALLEEVISIDVIGHNSREIIHR
jgi:hypothetical protein